MVTNHRFSIAITLVVVVLIGTFALAPFLFQSTRIRRVIRNAAYTSVQDARNDSDLAWLRSQMLASESARKTVAAEIEALAVHGSEPPDQRGYRVMILAAALPFSEVSVFSTEQLG